MADNISELPELHRKSITYEYFKKAVKYLGRGTNRYIFQIVNGARLEIEPDYLYLIRERQSSR